MFFSGQVNKIDDEMAWNEMITYIYPVYRLIRISLVARWKNQKEN